MSRAGGSTRLILGAALAAALLVGGGLFLLLEGRPAVSERLAPLVERYSGSPVIGGAWSLTDMRGQPITQAAPADSVTVIFFGFTHCPDACPTALAKVAQALDRLTPEEAARVRALLVSVDPARDDAATLAGYVTLFHPALLAASADEATLAEMAKGFRAYYRKVPLEGADYTIDHTTFLYLMDGEGRNLGVLGPTATAGEIAEALRGFLAALTT